MLRVHDRIFYYPHISTYVTINLLSVLLLRQLCCAFINHNHLHHDQAPRISRQQDVSITRLKTESQTTEKGKCMEEHEGRRQWKRVSALVGVFSAALLLGGGAVLCEAPEESSPDQNSAGTGNEDDRNQIRELGKEAIGQGATCSGDPIKNPENPKRQRRRFRMMIKGESAERKPHCSHVDATTPLSHEEAVWQARKLLRQRMQEIGAPGLSVGVTVDGKTVWTYGIVYSMRNEL